MTYRHTNLPLTPKTKTSTENIMFIFGEEENTLSSYFDMGCVLGCGGYTQLISIWKKNYCPFADIYYFKDLFGCGRFLCPYSLLNTETPASFKSDIFVHTSTVSVSSHVLQYFVLFWFSCYCFLFVCFSFEHKDGYLDNMRGVGESKANRSQQITSN